MSWRRWLGYNKEEKQENGSKLDLLELQKYISKKFSDNFHRDFPTPLALGKYQLALMVQSIVTEKTKIVEVIDYVDLRKCLFITYKMNEFLEHPGLYASNRIPIKSGFCNRKKEGKKTLIKYWRDELIKEGKESIACETDEKITAYYAEIEMMRLFRTMKQNFWHMSMPDDLPEKIATGSGYFTSELHNTIRALYQKLPKEEENHSLGFVIG